jgi:CBS domain-containing protein
MMLAAGGEIMFDFDVRGLSEIEADQERSSKRTALLAVAMDAPVADVPRGPTLALAPEASVASGLQAMRRRGRGGIVVVRQHRPIGVVTDRDILAQAGAGLGDLNQTPLSAVMAPCPAPLREDETVEAALRRMCALGRWFLPLVCGRGLALGALEMGDLALWLRDRMTLLSVDAALGPHNVIGQS